MRRFEFVAGTSAKFWMADVEGSSFIVVYGRLGTDGQRKEKDFPSEDAARRELEKKITEKLKEGYHEVAAAGGAAPPQKGAKGAAAASARLQLPPRVPARTPTPAALAEAGAALGALGQALTRTRKPRSWVIDLHVRRARRLLDPVAGADPAAHKPLAQPFADLMARVAVAGSGRLPLRLALQLLAKLDTAAFTAALAQWQKGPRPPAAVAVIARQVDALEDPELALRLSCVICADRDPSPPEAFTRRWRALQPFVEAHLISQGTTLKAFVQKFDAGGDAGIGDRVARLR